MRKPTDLDLVILRWKCYTSLVSKVAGELPGLGERTPVSASVQHELHRWGWQWVPRAWLPGWVNHVLFLLTHTLGYRSQYFYLAFLLNRLINDPPSFLLASGLEAPGPTHITHHLHVPWWGSNPGCKHPLRGNGTSRGDFPSGAVVKTLHFQCRGARAWSLVGELRSHMLHSLGKKKKKEHSQTSPSCGHMKMEQEMARLHRSKGKSSMFAVTHQPPSPSTFHSRTTADNRKIKFLAWKSCSLKADVQTGVLGGRSIPQFRGSSSQGAALLQALVFVCLF